MLSNNYDIQNYLLILEENINNLKTTQCSLTFNISAREIKKVISIIIKKNYSKKNLFDKYINTEIFSNILCFLPKEYVILKRQICKNWYGILSSDFIRKSLGPFTRPLNIYYSNSFDNNFKNIIRLDNKLCSYNYNDKYVIKILNNNGEIIGKTNKYIYNFNKNTELGHCNKHNFIINDPNQKIAIDENHICLLINYAVYIFDTKGKYVKHWPSHFSESNNEKILVNNGEIYVSNEWFRYIYVFSLDGKQLRAIRYSFDSTFDVYGNYVYVINKYNQLMIYTTEGKQVFQMENTKKNWKNLFVINDNLYIITNEKIHIYKIRFF